MEGTVKFFNRKKGFGFISGDDGKDYFVHFTALPKGVFLSDNDKVSFDGVEGDRGSKAESVQLLQKGSER
ncbi:MAG TPA: cold shock domain-containing protein, partial [Candidatus Nanoarchaeia archaeon]|nr:cold shock domain-containing protein [Candidatus Nanoarchaeia archaeon]